MPRRRKRKWAQRMYKNTGTPWHGWKTTPTVLPARSNSQWLFWEKNIWGAWPLIIWEATTAKRNYYIEQIWGAGQDLGACAPQFLHNVDRWKVTIEGYRNSPTLFRTIPSPTPYGLPFPKIGGSHSTIHTCVDNATKKWKETGVAAAAVRDRCERSWKD